MDRYFYGLTISVYTGKPMKQDICSMTIDDKRIFTFMSQALGLMADLDLGEFISEGL